MNRNNRYFSQLKNLAHMSLVIGALLCSQTLFAQANHEPKEILIKSNVSEGGFIGLNLQQASIFKQNITLTGGQGALPITQWLWLGLQAQTLTSRVQSNLTDSESIDLTTYGIFGEVNLYTWRYLSARASASMNSGLVGYRLNPKGHDLGGYEQSHVTERNLSLHIFLHIFEHAEIGLGYGRGSLSGIALPGFKSDMSKYSPMTINLRKTF